MSRGDESRIWTGVFRGGVALQSLGLVLVCALAASRAFFAEDDFRWLATVRAADFSWQETLFPLRERDWWAWRPLGMHAYFQLCFALFGFAPMGFYAVSLAFHFGGGLLVHRLARQLGFAPEVAAVTALLAVSRPPSMQVIHWASAFNYFSVAFFSLLSIVLFVAQLQRGGRGRRLASSLALGAALLCQESALLVPCVLIGLATALQRQTSRGAPPAPAPLRLALRRAMLSSAPQIAITGVWALYRFVLIAPHPRRFNYESVWGTSALRNAWRQLLAVTGGELALALSLAIAAAALALLVRSEVGRARLHDWLWPTAAALVVWCVAALLPFVSVRLGAARFAVALEVPLCLLFGSLLAALFIEPVGRTARLALLALLLAAMPYAPLAEALASPRGAGARSVLSQLEADAILLPPGSRLVVLYGEPAEGARDGAVELLRNAWWLHRETWSGTALWSAFLPDRGLSMAFRKRSDGAPALDLVAGCHYYEIDSELRIRPARPELRAAFFERALSSRHPGAAPLAARRLIEELAADAIDPVLAAARTAPVSEREAWAESLLRLDEPRAAAAAAALIPDAARRRELRRAQDQKKPLSVLE